MTAQTSYERPAIVLCHNPSADPILVDAFCYGCEEDGVPAFTQHRDGDADSIARNAAAASALFIGAGIDVNGEIALHEHRMGRRPPLLRHASATAEVARLIGVAAGRFARGRPISKIVAHDNIIANHVSPND